MLIPHFQLFWVTVKSEIEQRPLAEIFGHECATFAVEAITGDAGEGESCQSQFKITTKSGRERWIFLSVTVECKRNALIGLANGFDITSQKMG